MVKCYLQIQNAFSQVNMFIAVIDFTVVYFDKIGNQNYDSLFWIISGKIEAKKLYKGIRIFPNTCLNTCVSTQFTHLKPSTHNKVF